MCLIDLCTVQCHQHHYDIYSYLVMYPVASEKLASRQMSPVPFLASKRQLSGNQISRPLLITLTLWTSLYFTLDVFNPLEAIYSGKKRS